MMKYYGVNGLTLTVLLLSFLPACRNAVTPHRELTAGADWPVYGGNPAGNRYSPLQQIDTGNVSQLVPAWVYDTGENNTAENNEGGDIQCQPIVVDGILYGTTPSMKLFAIDAATGKERWKFDPFSGMGKQKGRHPLRGVTWWQDGDDRRILYGAGSMLYAVKAENGQLVDSFGDHGKTDLHQGIGDEQSLGHPVNNLGIRLTTPGIIYRDLIITGSSMSESGDAPPGYIRAFSARTGKLAWTFHTIPLPGEYGYDTWPDSAYRYMGGANCWAGMVLDEKRGIVYAGTGSPTNDFYGGDRKGQNLFANCILALDATTGKRIWHYQTIHHDLWDRDIPCQPNLVTVRHHGKLTEAVAQATKDGLIFLLDRDSGNPLFDVQEKPVPVSPALPGESPWPTQPLPDRPAPFSLQELTPGEITTRTKEGNTYVLDRYLTSVYGSKFMPPSQQGSLYFGMGGGAEWGGNAADPRGILYVNGNNMLWDIRMRDTKEENGHTSSRGQLLFQASCMGCHGGIDRHAGEQPGHADIPSLSEAGRRLNREAIQTILLNGRGRMPSFRQLAGADRNAIMDYILHTEQPVKINKKKTAIPAAASVKPTKTIPGFPYVAPFVNNGLQQFRDPGNYPAVKPPWGTLNAIDLNTGDYRWTVPLGYYPALNGMPATGTENHGGPVVTAGGLLFIAATYDLHLRAFNSRNGQVLWQYLLPAGGFATPVTYMVNGIQYVAIAAGGGRYSLKNGGKYMAFCLSEKKP